MINTPADQKNNVETNQLILANPELFTGASFDACSVYSTLGALATNHQSQSGKGLLAGCCQQQEGRIAHLPFGVVKNGLILATGKKSVLAVKARLSGTVTSAGGTGKTVGLGSQPLTTLGTTSGQNLATVLGGHAGTETVSTLALEYAGLECTFHVRLPVLVTAFQKAGKSRE